MKKFHFKHSRCWSQLLISTNAPVSKLVFPVSFFPFFSSFYDFLLKLYAVTSFISFHTNVTKRIIPMLAFCNLFQNFHDSKTEKTSILTVYSYFFCLSNSQKLTLQSLYFTVFLKIVQLIKGPALTKYIDPIAFYPKSRIIIAFRWIYSAGRENSSALISSFSNISSDLASIFKEN